MNTINPNKMICPNCSHNHCTFLDEELSIVMGRFLLQEITFECDECSSELFIRRTAKIEPFEPWELA